MRLLVKSQGGIPRGVKSLRPVDCQTSPAAAASIPRATLSIPETKLHHVGIIVPAAEQVQVLMDLLGLQVGHTQYVPQYEADCIFTWGERGVLEFVVPRGGVLTKFNKSAGGLHHIALEVNDLEGRSAELRAKGVQLLEERPVDAGCLWINFLPPAYTRGIIIELVQPKVG
jgi:methylmalonyl-CoA/ethylmalonyl-CoA epimerase